MNKPSQYPSLNLAYEYVIPSYGWALSRFEAVERRIERLLMLILAATIAVPVFLPLVREEPVHLSTAGWKSILILGAIVLFVLAASIGIYARQAREVSLVDPGVHYRESLSLPHWEFQRNAIYFAAEHMKENVANIALKSRLADCMAGLFGIEIVMWVVWAIL